MQDMEGSIHESNGFETYEEDFESEVARLEVGDNFVVILNELENNDPFYVLLCGKPLHRCEAIWGWLGKPMVWR